MANILVEGELLAAPRDGAGGAIRHTGELPTDSKTDVLASSGRICGPIQDVGGVEMVPVRFAVEGGPHDRILVHMNGWTDRHRRDYRPSLLEWVPSLGLHLAEFLLPADGIVSYRIANVTDLPHDVGCERGGWVQVHERGCPDPNAAEQLATPLGGNASVWYGPRLRVANWPQSDTERWTHCDRDGRCIRVLPGTREVVVLFDGQYWEPLALGAQLRELGIPFTVVTISSTREQRERDLTDGAAAAALVHTALAAASEVIGARVGTACLVAGQSFGGLAAALLAAQYPGLINRALVQSGSFWYPDFSLSGQGELLRGLRAGRWSVSCPVSIQVGSEEGEMVELARDYRDIVRARGGQAQYCEARGGHDYAWWRRGLVEELLALHETTHAVEQ